MKTLLLLMLFQIQSEVVGRTCFHKTDCSQGEVCMITEPNSNHGKCVKIK